MRARLDGRDSGLAVAGGKGELALRNAAPLAGCAQKRRCGQWVPPIRYDVSVWQVMVTATLTTTSREQIRSAAAPGRAAKPARGTTAPCIDALTRLRVLDDLPAWAPTHNHLR